MDSDVNCTRRCAPRLRETARVKFSNTLAFLDGVIEHLSKATPV